MSSENVAHYDAYFVLSHVSKWFLMFQMYNVTLDGGFCCFKHSVSEELCIIFYFDAFGFETFG